MKIGRFVGGSLAVALLASVILSAVALAADDGKMMTCPSAAPTAIGTATKRLELAFKNESSNDICVSTRASFTCDGTVGTDGYHCDTGPCLWLTETSVASPATTVWRCRAATSDSAASLMELFQ